MRKAIFVLMVLSLCVTVFGQTVVSKASKLVWDDDNPADTATHYRVYVQDTPGVVPDGISFVGVVTAPTKEWIISSDIGSHHAVVTLVNDDGVTIIETGPSNEVHYVVPGPPTNAEAIR